MECVAVASCSRKGSKLRQDLPDGQDSNPGSRIGKKLNLRLHLLRNLDSEKIEAFGEDSAAKFAQGQTRRARWLFRFEDGARFVEGVEGVRELVEIVREKVRTEIVQDRRHGFGELAELQCERSFLRR